MPGFAGFDTDIYPGDDVMAWLQANTNLVWCGYYLAPAPSHCDASWMGKRSKLATAGWGLMPTYLGQQVIGKGSHNPNATTGSQDGTDAANMMAAEGFPLGSYVYLDIENGPPLTSAQVDYVGAWCDAVIAQGYGAGVYCSHLLAKQVNNLRAAARIWAFRISAQQFSNPYPNFDPSGCGYTGAYVWQLAQNYSIDAPTDDGTLCVDLSSATVADPSVPDPPATLIA